MDKILLGILFNIVIVALTAIPVTFLWNRQMPKIFGLPKLQWQDAVQLLLLAYLLLDWPVKITFS